MSDLPECLQPALEQLNTYVTKISALESKNRDLDMTITSLSEEKEALQNRLEEENRAHLSQVDNYEKEKQTLRELNVVVSDQLREQAEELNTLRDLQNRLEEENTNFKDINEKLSDNNDHVNAQSIRLSADQEALSQHAQQLSEELESLRSQNAALKEENSALTLVNSAMHQRQLQSTAEGENNNEALVAEIARLKEALDAQASVSPVSTDESFLQRENERLMQRHGEITQEKMQASAKMHVAQKELQEATEKLDTALKTISQLEFELQGLQNLHKNLTQERDALITDNGSLVAKKAEAEEKSEQLGELLQQITAEKELLSQELNQEHIKADTMTEEVNHLRLKSRALAEEIKALKESAVNPHEPIEKIEPEVEALEIDSTYAQEDETQDEIEIVSSSNNTGPHFPGEYHKN